MPLKYFTPTLDKEPIKKAANQRSAAFGHRKSPELPSYAGSPGPYYQYEIHKPFTGEALQESQWPT